MPSEHKPCSPSGGERWENCPATLLERKRQLELGLSGETEYSREGTEAHGYSENVLLGKMTLDDVPEEFRDGVALYVRSIQMDLELFDGELLAVEKMITWEPDERVGGTPDCVHRVGDTLVVTDLKYGAGEYVEANTFQLQIYGYLALQEYSDGYINNVELRVVQPRYVRDDVDPIRSHVWDALELEAVVSERLIKALEQIDKYPDKRVPGDHCRWCPAMRVPGMPPCSAHVANYQALLASAPIVDVRPPDLATLKDAQKIKWILDRAEMLDALVKQARATAEYLIYNGEEIEGYSLQEKFGNRKWRIGDDKISDALAERGLGENQIWTRKIISPAQAEKAGLKGEIDDLVTKESKGLQLTRAKKLDKEIKHSVKKLLADNPLPKKTGKKK